MKLLNAANGITPTELKDARGNCPTHKPEQSHSTKDWGQQRKRDQRGAIRCPPISFETTRNISEYTRRWERMPTSSTRSDKTRCGTEAQWADEK